MTSVKNSTSGGLLALVLTTTLITATATAAHADLECLPSTWSEAEAAENAVACGGEVEVESLRSETAEVFAQPDGSFIRVESMEPERVRSPSRR
ncbi:hypothetical protein [Stackebrandtia soli]|uniref:hypothetical protein n=1 Tax=Stackebrandtia soli TaxID=1892856 RepID=UPI0039E7912B